MPFDFLRAQLVVIDGGSVLPTIDFNYQIPVVAHKIENIFSEHVLAAELMSIRLPHT